MTSQKSWTESCRTSISDSAPLNRYKSEAHAVKRGRVDFSFPPVRFGRAPHGRRSPPVVWRRPRRVEFTRNGAGGLILGGLAGA